MYRDYRRVDGYPDYIVSNYGEVYSIKKYHGTEWREIKQHIDKDGYYKVGILKNGKLKTNPVHVLVGNNFIGKRTGEFTFDHIDRNRINNRADNIRLASKSLQNINQKKRPSKLNEKYIYLQWKGNREYYRFCIQRKIDGKIKKIANKYYNVKKYTLDDVIKVRDEYIKNNPSYFIFE